MSGTSTIRQFQDYMWNSLPVRRAAVGREVIDDVVLLAIQFWPVEELSQAAPRSKEEFVSLADLADDIRRVFVLVYGLERVEALLLLGLDKINPLVIDNLCDWWRRRKDNRAKLIIWRRRWRSDG